MASRMTFHSLLFALALGAALPSLSAATAHAQVPTTTPARDTSAAAPASAASADGRWQASVYGSWLPGIGEAKRGALEGGPPGAAPGYGLRLERGLHEWWSAGLMLSSRSWEIDAPQAATGGLSNGSFLDAALLVKFHPLTFNVAGGPLSLYLAAAGGPTLAGSKRGYAAGTADGAAPGESADLLSFEAGYNTSAWLGASWLPTEHWGLFVEAGFDWHFAVHSRNTVDLAQPLAAGDEPNAIAEKLWLGQAMLNVGALYRF
jgi:hypothetical protein